MVESKLVESKELLRSKRRISFGIIYENGVGITCGQFVLSGSVQFQKFQSHPPLLQVSGYRSTRNWLVCSSHLREKHVK